MELASLLARTRSLPDLSTLLAALGHEPLWDPVPGLCRGTAEPPVVVGRTKAFPWYALAGHDAERRARALARRLAGRGRLCGVLGLDAATRRLTLAAALDGVPWLTAELDRPSRAHLASLARLAAGSEGTAAYGARVADALAGEAVGRRFFREFRAILDRMAAALPRRLGPEDRRALALLQLTRVLFLYFVQAKGWLGGQERFLADQVDRCLARRRRVHRDLLRPLFFGTLNRPPAERSRIARSFGPVPFLNGGLFEPHPLERRLRADFPNDLWRDVFDRLFERFHFTVAEGGTEEGIAPDMLGRVFEGVMAPDARRTSGTYYTPAALVSSVLDAALGAWVAGRLHCSETEARRRLEGGDPGVTLLLGQVTILDPAVGSGAFLLGALERLAGLVGTARGAMVRRRILERNLFGVDRNGAAVRLTELRLWLAVVAAEPSERPDAVRPLPNLDCLVRQGDSLFDPIGSGLRPASGLPAAGLAQLRHRLVTAAGPEKRALVRELTRAEASIAANSLSELERSLQRSTASLLASARSRDLFGQQRGLDPEQADALARLRAELHRARRLRRSVARENEVPWFHYHVQFADVFAAGGFDLVVGNPPWLRAEDMAPELRARLAGRYRWWRCGRSGWANRPDLAVAFLERSVELAAPDGIIALLVPAKIARAGYGAAARHGLASTTTLITVADLTGKPEASFDATVYPLAVIARVTSPPSNHRVRATLGPGRGGIRQARLSGGAPWVITGDRLFRWLAELRADHPRIDASFGCHLGVKTGANRVFLDPPVSEPSLLRWAIRGRDLAGLTVAPRRRLLWTHGPDGAPLPRLSPRVQAYLEPHRRPLLSRADYDGGPHWTLFRTRAATAPHRAVWADVARRLSAAALTAPADDELIPLNSCYVAPAQSAEEAERLAAWLNASWLRMAAQAAAVPASGGYARFSAATVGSLPLPGAVLADVRLDPLARRGRAGADVQVELDDIAAEHLGLAPALRSALRRVAAERADHRG